MAATENTNKFEYIAFLHDEQATAIAVGVIQRKFPNVEFEASEYGDGTYRVVVRSVYKDRVVSQQSLSMFRKTLLQIHEIVLHSLHFIEEKGGVIQWP